MESPFSKRLGHRGFEEKARGRSVYAPASSTAYLLGGLNGEERAFRAHLETCPICQAEARDLEPIVAALAKAAPDHVEEALGLPSDLEERTFARIEQARVQDLERASVQDQVGQRLRRLVSRPALAVAASLLIVVAGFALYPRLFAPRVPIEPVAFSETAPGVEAEANLIDHTWGTETILVVSGLEDGETYKLTLRNEDGASVPSGAFIALRFARQEETWC